LVLEREHFQKFAERRAVSIAEPELAQHGLVTLFRDVNGLRDALRRGGGRRIGRGGFIDGGR
jgi:hypothetical protein